MNKREPKISVIISVAIAIALWLYVMGEVDPNTSQRFNNIPVTFENIESLEEKDLVFDQEEDFSIDIVVYGRTSEMYGLRNKLEAKVTLDSIDEKGTYNLKVRINGIPETLDLRRVYNEEISVEIDRITDNTKEVYIEIEGEPARGLSILYTEISPETVKLNGPEEILSRVDKVVGTVAIDNADGDIIENIALTPVDEDGKLIEGIDLSTSFAKVSIHIGQKRTIPIEAQIISQLDDEYFIREVNIFPEEITIGAKGNILNDIDKVMTEEIVLDGSSENISEEVSVQLPNNVAILNNGNNKVTVSIAIEKKQTKNFEISEIEQLNLLENIEVNLKETLIIVTLEGRQDDLDALTERDIQLSIDLDELDQGKHQVPIVLNPIEGIALVEILPREIQVELKNIDSEENVEQLSGDE